MPSWTAALVASAGAGPVLALRYLLGEPRLLSFLGLIDLAMMGHVLRWRDRCSVAVSPDDREVWLFATDGPVRLAGLNSGPLARAVTGTRTRDEVVEAARVAGFDVTRAQELIDKWIRSGHLTDAAVVTSDRPRVSLVNGSDVLRAALEGADLDVRDTDADVTVVVVDDLLTAGVDLPRNMGTVIAVQLRGPRALVSPLLGPGLGCAECLASRIAVRRGADLVASRRAGLTWPPASPIAHPQAVPLAAGVVASMVRTGMSSTQHVHVIDPETGEVARHRLVAVPGCALCDPEGTSLLGGHLVESSASESGAAIGGAGLVGSRTVDPDETWLAHAHHVSDVVGIVPVVEPVGPLGLRVYGSGSNLVGIDDPAVAASVLRNRGGGKGLTLAAARAGALAESLERDALRWRGDEHTVVARYSELEHAIHPNAVQLFSESQMTLAEMAWISPGEAKNKSHPVPYRFDAEAEVRWSAVRSLVTGDLHWLPTSMMYLGAGFAPGLPPACSNGAAAGNTYAEAILQGLLELVERDAVALWWYPRSTRHYFDLQAWGDPRVLAAAAPHLAAGSDLRVLDLTTDIGIPAAVAITRGGGLPVPVLGAGAHPDPAIAVARAITEAAQMRAALGDLDADDPKVRKWVDESWASQLTDEDATWFWGTTAGAPVEAPNYGSVTEARDDVIARIHTRGHDVLWADLSRRDHGLTVVRTYAPGLRHFWRRLAPGRLYDVPRDQGWVARPLTEETINPIPMPL